MVLMVLVLNFNSIKVRLKLLAWLVSLDYLIFQFHKGTIKTNKASMERHHRI